MILRSSGIIICTCTWIFFGAGLAQTVLNIARSYHLLISECLSVCVSTQFLCEVKTFRDPKRSQNCNLMSNLELIRCVMYPNENKLSLPSPPSSPSSPSPPPLLPLLSSLPSTVCAENHVRTWTVTRFRGRISTQPGSNPVASFKVLSLEGAHSLFYPINSIGESLPLLPHLCHLWGLVVIVSDWRLDPGFNSWNYQLSVSPLIAGGCVLLAMCPLMWS